MARDIKTYIKELDLLFGDKIEAVDGRNPCILLEGHPGSGKTTLAAQIAIGVARATKGVSIIYSVEQTPFSLKKKVSSFNWLRDGDTRSLLLSGSDKDVEKAVKTKEGCIFLLSTPKGNLPTDRKSVV